MITKIKFIWARVNFAIKNTLSKINKRVLLNVITCFDKILKILIILFNLAAMIDVTL